MRRLAILCTLTLATGVAHADKADQLFKKGKKLLAEKRYSEACAAFEQSDKLDPGIGAKLNVAKCFQEWGRIGTALRWYHQAEQMATEAKDDRAAKIHKLASDLDNNVPRLTVKVPDGADIDGLIVKLDGNVLESSALGVDQRLDPGPHKIDYEIGSLKKSKVVPLERGGSSEVLLDLPKKSAAKPDKPDKPDKPIKVVEPPVVEPPPPVVKHDNPGSTQRIIGIGVGAAGVVAIGVASFITLKAKSDYNNAIKDHCNGAKDMCDADGLTQTHDARSRANTATIITIVGGAAIIGGVVLFVLAPSEPKRTEHALYITPAIDARGAGFVVGGAF